MTDPHYNKVKAFILELGYSIIQESEEDGLIIISDESLGINRLMIGVADPLIILEQYIFTISKDFSDTYLALLKKNRDIIHGAFVLDETGKKVLFRDTLEIENLDLNELEGSINSLALLLSEYSEELISFTHS